MAVSVTLPALGESVSEGTVTRWLKRVGEKVHSDEPLLEVSADKVDTEIPAPTSGTLLEILIGEGETAEVGAKLAIIAAPGAALPEPAPAVPAPAAPVQEAPTPASAPAAEVTPSPLRGQTVPMTRVRMATAKHMIKSLQVSAQLTTVVEVDVTKIMKLREKAKADFQQRQGVKLTPLPFFVKAAAEALRLHPLINASVNEDDTITYHDVENIGIAVDTDKGLFVPVIRGVGDLNIAGIAKMTAAVAARTRKGSLKPDELTGGTFTVTNTGSRGALFDTPILNQPQVGILGIGTTLKRPVVVETEEGAVIGVRDMVYLALSYDHRIVDGADAARFLATVKARLEAGEFEGGLAL
jgi:2-oxoglutarate dehydrogenase E2 component (dihydrolipoamide succinyltransferase)